MTRWMLALLALNASARCGSVVTYESEFFTRSSSRNLGFRIC
jgi:hypothetical protein